MAYPTNRLLLNLTTGGTSGAFDVSDRRRISIQGLYTESSAGTVRITIQASHNNDDWVNYERIVSNIVSGVLGDEKATTRLTLSSTVTSGMLFLPFDPALSYIRVVATKYSPRVAETTGKVKVWIQANE